MIDYLNARIVETYITVSIIFCLLYYYFNQRDKKLAKIEQDRVRLLIEKENTKKMIELTNKIGLKENILNKIIVLKKPKIERQNSNNRLKYSWEKMLVTDISEYPKVKVKIIDTDEEKQEHKVHASTNSVVIVDLLHQASGMFITQTEFDADIKRIEEYDQIQDLKKELNNFFNLQKKYAMDYLLWEKYYEGLPVEYYNDMNGVDFEKYVENLLVNKGYVTLRTPPSRDQGVDIIIKDGYKKIAIQVKKYSNKVGNQAVQEVTAGKKFYKCSEAWVITNSTYTKSAIQLAKANKVRLIDGIEMTKMFNDVSSRSGKVPDFDEDKLQQVRLFAEKFYTIQEYEIADIATPFDSVIEYLKLMLEKLEKSNSGL